MLTVMDIPVENKLVTADIRIEATYQSRIRIFLQLSPKSFWQTLEAMQTLLNRQNPIVLLTSA